MDFVGRSCVHGAKPIACDIATPETQSDRAQAVSDIISAEPAARASATLGRTRQHPIRSSVRPFMRAAAASWGSLKAKC
jgi:hypothetical protein